MKRVALIIVPVLCWCTMADALEAGAAKVDITGPIGAPLSGYGARMGRSSTGVHDPIWSRALYLDDGTTSLFLVGVDLIGVMPELRERVVELMPDIVPPENVFLSATHTHSAQGGMTRTLPIRFVSGRYTPDLLEQTAQGIADSMRNAYDKRTRAALGYATGAQEGLSVNRRDRDGPIDPQVGVILVEDADGAPISIVTNFAAHPTSISGDSLFLYSADYPGFYYLEMEALLGPECVPIFLNGALGNQTTGNPEQKSGWERTESIGRLLARRVHDIADTIMFGDVTLRTAHTEAQLPGTMLDILLPEHTLLQALEINDLLISFFPGEACVELALEMRRRALARGYDAHFSVGLSTNHLMYFVPRHLYPQSSYESTSSFFGPGMADWFYTHFEGMMHRDAPTVGDENAEQEEPPPVIQTVEIANGLVVDLAGGPHDRGRARGAAFNAAIQRGYQNRVVAPVENGDWLPTDGMLAYMPPFIDTTALGLPLLGMQSRDLLRGISLDLIKEMEGMAEGARLPFDGFWLLQHAPLYDRVEDKTQLFSTPLCTMFAVVGDRAHGAELLVGRNLDWPLPEEAIVTRVYPKQGSAFMQVGFTWNTGVFTAMNEHGVVLCVERVELETTTVPEKAPIEFLLRDIIQNATDYEQALQTLQQATHIRGVHVLVAGHVENRPEAAVVEFGETVSVRQPGNGLLLGVTPDHPTAPDATRKRYTLVFEALSDVQGIDQDTAQALLTQNADTDAYNALAAPWNKDTRHSVLFRPGEQRMYVSLPTSEHTPGTFLATPLFGDLEHE